MNTPCQLFCPLPPMIPLPYQPLYQPFYQPNYPFLQQQPHFQHQSSIQPQLHQQQFKQQKYYEYYYSPQYHQQFSQHFLQLHSFPKYIHPHPQYVHVYSDNTQSASPNRLFSYEQSQRMKSLMPENYPPSGDTQSSDQSTPNTIVLPKENLSQTISEKPYQVNQVSANNLYDYEIKLEQSKDHHGISSSQQHLIIKEEQRLSETSTATKFPIKLPEKNVDRSDEKRRTSSKNTQEMMDLNNSKQEQIPLEKKEEEISQPKNESGDNYDFLENPNDSIEEDNQDFIPGQQKRVSKQKSTTQKAENRKIKEELLGMSSSAQKELLLQIQKVSKQNSAKAFLKAYKKFALGKQEYIYNYDISENQYYYKLCHDMPLVRIEDPSKKDLEGFYRKLKKFFQGKQYNNSTLKTVVRNKLYGQLFDDFLRTQSGDWLEHTKSKNKDDLRIIIQFLLLCHKNKDYLIFLRDQDKSKGKKYFEDLSE